MPQRCCDQDLLDLLYAAPGELELWHEFLAFMSDRLQAPGAGLIVNDFALQRYGISIHLGLPVESHRPYADYYGAVDPWFLGGRKLPVGTVELGSWLCPPSAFRKTEFYNDFLRKHHPYFYQSGIIVASRGEAQSFLTFLRERRQSDFEKKDVRFLKSLFPHVQRALQLHRKVLDIRQIATVGTDTLDKFDVGLIGVRTDGTICFANQMGDAQLRSGRFLIVSSGKIVCKDNRQDGAFSELLRGVHTRRMMTVPGGALTLFDTGGAALHVTVIPFRADQNFLSPDPFALIVLTYPAATPGSREQSLKALFGLTPGESRVAMLLVQGHEPRAIANLTHTRENTVRSQLKEIYRKAKINRQSQLVRLISLLPGRS